MALIAMVSAKSAPGITTSVALLASVWPSQVVVVDADPVGGSLATGWLGGLAYPDRSILSFAIETANSGVSGPAKLDRHLQRVPGVPDCLLMAGLTDSTQLRFITSAAWHRLANALSELSRSGSDVLVDCGRFGSTTPMPLLTAADLVLIAVRPRERDWGAARCLAGQLRSVTDADRLGLAVCATTPLGTMATEQYLGLYAIVALPNNRRVAMAFSDRRRRSVGFGRSRLVRTAARTASLLHVVVNKDQSTVPPQVGAARVFDGPQYESKWSG
ncbi:MAG TPA: ParA family protein [Pseudonocardiaceae bacterium]|nr:ParA family protein [Pseudonocardiaceae bacterium]